MADEERIVMPKSFSLHGAKFEVNPLQDFLLKRQIATNEVFARAYHTDMTKVFYDTIEYKVKNKENIATGIKGATRCLSCDTLIRTIEKDDVVDMRLDEIKSPVSVLSYNFIKNVLEPDSARVIDSGVKKIFELKTVSGKRIYATKEHKLFVFDNGVVREKTVANIKVGDKLVGFKSNELRNAKEVKNCITTKLRQLKR